MEPGLYLVGTPIGSARDITLRALDVLASADVLAAEDTRSLRRLLDIHGVPLRGRRLLAYHDHSGESARNGLLGVLGEGASVAYASEAGMPMIADPGYDLARAATEAGHRVTAAPGASAPITALALAGLPTDAFFFGGFLPSAAAQRRARLEVLRDIPGTLVLFESPHRVAASLDDAAAVLGGDREAALARELTKKFEEIRRAPLARLADGVRDDPPKGEIVLLIDRARSQTVRDSGDMTEELRDAMTKLTLKDAVDLVARARNLPRRQVYQAALQMTKDKD